MSIHDPTATEVLVEEMNDDVGLFAVPGSSREEGGGSRGQPRGERRRAKEGERRREENERGGDDELLLDLDFCIATV